MGARRLKLKINQYKMLRFRLFSTVRSFSFLLTILGHELGDTRRSLGLPWHRCWFAMVSTEVMGLKSKKEMVLGKEGQRELG